MTNSDDNDNLSQFSVPDDIVEEYGGKWVAQLHGKVIAHGDSVRDVQDVLPETEERPTIWHVPTAESAEADGWSLLYDDGGLTVCTEHKRFVPCRRCDREHREYRELYETVSKRWSNDPEDVEAVRLYQSGNHGESEQDK